MILTLGFTWGWAFLLTDMALDGIPPFWLAAGRIGFGAALSLVIWQALGGRLFASRPTKIDRINLVVIAALSSAVPFTLLAWGLQYVTSGFAGVSMASVALIVLPMAHVMVPGERMTWRRTLGLVIGFAGVSLLIGAGAFDRTGAALEMPGRLACVGAAACYAVSSVLMRRLPPVDPIGLSTILLVIGAGFVIPIAWRVEGPLITMPDGRTLWLVALLGLVPTAAANLLRVAVIRSAGPVFMSLVNYMVPVWAVLLGAWLLGETLPPTLLWAMVLILGGVGLSQYGALRRLFSGSNHL